VGVERPGPINGQERPERFGCDPSAPVGTTDPVRDLALARVTPRPNRSGDVVVEDDDPGEHRLVSSNPRPAALECVPFHVVRRRKGGHLDGDRIRPLLEEQRQVLIPYFTQREFH
jgi:hypothetical protein